MKNEYVKSGLRGLSMGAGVVLVLLIAGGLCLAFAKGFVMQNVYIAASIVDGIPLDGCPVLNRDSVLSAVMGYYNQIISILIALVAVSAAVAFLHIGAISREKAEEIAREAAEKIADAHFKSQIFYDDVSKKVSEALDREYSVTLEGMEDVQRRVNGLEEKYDRHDDILNMTREALMPDRVIVEGGVGDGDNT